MEEMSDIVWSDRQGWGGGSGGGSGGVSLSNSVVTLLSFISVGVLLLNLILNALWVSNWREKGKGIIIDFDL
jgi:hypothetical protein